MKKINVSKDLVSLILIRHSSIEYFLSETLGYISDSNSKQLKDGISINTREVVQIELSDGICDELRANFDESLTLEQAVNIVMLCGYIFGGV